LHGVQPHLRRRGGTGLRRQEGGDLIFVTAHMRSRPDWRAGDSP
jgi:hypothetical protein